MVEGFVLPEGLPRSAKNQVGLQESRGHYTGYSGIPQPNRPESSFVHFTVQDEEGSAHG
jgi:hypothetical protein